MLKTAVALLLVCASIAMWVGCVSSTNQYLYAALPVSSQILAYREDPNSGVLTELSVSPIAAGPAVEALAVHPSKKYLYAANSFENDISLFTISGSGALTEVTPRALTGTTPSFLSMDSSGSFLYVGNVASRNISVFTISTTNGGALTEVPGSPFAVGPSPTSIQISPGGNALYVTSSGTPGNLEVWTVNSGTLTNVAQVLQVGTNPAAMAIDPTGTYLYLANTAPDNSIWTFTINSDGTLNTDATTVGGATLASPVSILVDKSDKYFYAVNESASNVSVLGITSSNGSLSVLSNGSPFATNAKPGIIASDPGGKYLFVGNTSSPAIESFSLDVNTGGLTEVNSYSTGNTPTSIVITPP
jgi:6-phosphogluconolactonase